MKFMLRNFYDVWYISNACDVPVSHYEQNAQSFPSISYYIYEQWAYWTKWMHFYWKKLTIIKLFITRPVGLSWMYIHTVWMFFPVRWMFMWWWRKSTSWTHSTLQSVSENGNYWTTVLPLLFIITILDQKYFFEKSQQNQK